MDVSKYKELDQYTPGFISIIDISDFTVHYISPEMAEQMALTPEEINNINFEEYANKMVAPEMAKYVLISIYGYCKGKFKTNDFFYYIKARYNENKDYEWFCVSFKLHNQKNLLIAQIQPVKHSISMHVTSILSKFLNNGLKAMEYYKMASTLSNREKDVLKLVIRDYSSTQICNDLNISKHTVNNHRKNIIKKLNIESLTDLKYFPPAI